MIIFLDNHSTTPVDDRVLQVMLPYFQQEYANPSSPHLMGIKSKEVVELARKQVASLLKASENDVYFTNSATEANNIILKGLYLKHRYSNITFISSPLEHKSVLSTLKWIERFSQGESKVLFTQVDKFGNLDLQHLELLLKYTDGNAVVSLMSANNEIGTIYPIKDIFTLCKKYSAFFHTDATQAIQEINIDYVDALTFSGHKIYGPKGVGCLYLKNIKWVEPLLNGGNQNIVSSGTLNVPAIIGMGKACELFQHDPLDFSSVAQLRDCLLLFLNKEIDGLSINGSISNRLYNNLNISIDGIQSEAIIESLDDVMISGMSACEESGDKEVSHVLTAIGCKNPESALRFGLNKFNTKKEIEYAADRIIELVKILRI